jgi:hypothetical protein
MCKSEQRGWTGQHTKTLFFEKQMQGSLNKDAKPPIVSDQILDRKWTSFVLPNAPLPE